MFVRTHILSLIFLVSAFSKEPTEGEKLFSLHIKPLFAEKCMACHGDEPEKIKSEFDMRTRESILRGGEIFEDEVLIPGQGEKSYLYILSTRVEEDLEMPPKESDKLTKEETDGFVNGLIMGPLGQVISELLRFRKSMRRVSKWSLPRHFRRTGRIVDTSRKSYGHTVH